MIRKLLTIFLLCASAAATVTVRAKLTDGTGTVSKTAYLHFQLENCGPNIPSDPTIGAAAIQTNFDLRPNQPDGTILYTNLLSNDEIFCGGVASTYWVVTPMKDQSHPLRDGLNYVLHNGTTFDPSVTQAMITVPLAPPQDPLCCGSPLVQGQGTGGGGSGGGGSINCNSPNANVYWLFGLLCDPFFTDDGVGNFTAFSGTFIGPKAGWINLFPGPTPVVPSLPGFQLTAQTSMSGPVQWLAPSTVGALGLAICVQSTDGVVSDTLGYCAFSSGTGSVISVACGNLSPLFTCAVSDPTNAAALAFTLSNAAANTVFGNFTGSSGAPSFNAMSACGDSTHALAWTAGTGFTCQAISAGSAVSITGTSPITVTPSPITGTGDVECPTCQVYTKASNPSAPTLATTGSAGSTSYTYLVVGNQDGGSVSHSAASATTTIATGNATLSSSNAIKLSGYADTLYGYRCYDIYRTATAGTPNTTGKIATCVWKVFEDTGLAGDSSTAPNTNNTVLDPNGLTAPLPGCNKIPGAPWGIDGPPCVGKTLSDEFTDTNGIGNTNNPTFAWRNQGTSTATLTNGELIYTPQPAGADSIRLLVMTPPAAPYTFVTTFLPMWTNGTPNQITGVCLGDGTKIITYASKSANANGTIEIDNWTNTTTFSSNSFTLTQQVTGPTWTYLRVQNDNTNLIYSHSFDGINYIQDFSAAKGAFLGTITEFGLCSESTNAGATPTMSVDYMRQTQ